MGRLKCIPRAVRGEALVEYALILALVSTLATGALTQVGGGAQAVFETVTEVLESTCKAAPKCGSKPGNPDPGNPPSDPKPPGNPDPGKPDPGKPQPPSKPKSGSPQ